LNKEHNSEQSSNNQINNRNNLLKSLTQKGNQDSRKQVFLKCNNNTIIIVNWKYSNRIKNRYSQLNKYNKSVQESTL